MLIFPRERGTFPEQSGKDPRTLGREAGTLEEPFGPGVGSTVQNTGEPVEKISSRLPFGASDSEQHLRT